MQKASTAELMVDDEEFLNQDNPKRRYSSCACCCCGVWSVIGVIVLVLGIAALVGYFKYWPVGKFPVPGGVGPRCYTTLRRRHSDQSLHVTTIPVRVAPNR